MGALEQSLAGQMQSGGEPATLHSTLTDEQQEGLVSSLVQGSKEPTSGRLRGRKAAEEGREAARKRAATKQSVPSGRLAARLKEQESAKQRLTEQEAEAAAEVPNPVDDIQVAGEKAATPAADAILERLLNPAALAAGSGPAAAGSGGVGRTKAPTPEELGADAFTTAATISQIELGKVTAERDATLAKKDMANQARAKAAAQAETARAEGQAEAAAVRAESMEEMNLARESGQEAIKVANSKINQKMSQYETAVQQYRNAPIGVTQTRRQKAFSVIAIAMGAFAQGQTGGANPAAEVIQASLDQALKEQQMEINRLGQNVDFSNNALANARSLFDDEVQAQRAARTMLMEDLKLSLSEVEARSSSQARRFEARSLQMKIEEENLKFRADIAQSEQAAVRRDTTQLEMADLNAQRQAKSESAQLNARFQEAARRDALSVRNQRAKLQNAMRNPRINPTRYSTKWSGLKGGWEALKRAERGIAKGISTGVWDSAKPGFLRDEQEQEVKATYNQAIIGTIKRDENGKISDSDKRIAFEDHGTGSFTTEAQGRGGVQKLKNGYYSAIREAVFDNPQEAISELGLDLVREALQAEAVLSATGTSESIAK